jgi:hypothetical protein
MKPLDKKGGLSMETTKGWKLFRQRKDGSLGPLFINRKQRVMEGEWMAAESHPTKGFAVRPYWHATSAPIAPHLSKKGRVWVPVELRGVKLMNRPEGQGGQWYLAGGLRVVPVGEQLTLNLGA